MCRVGMKCRCGLGFIGVDQSGLRGWGHDTSSTAPEVTQIVRISKRVLQNVTPGPHAVSLTTLGELPDKYPEHLFWITQWSLMHLGLHPKQLLDPNLA